MFKEETYPKPIFSSSMFAVFRTDIEPTDPRHGFVALDENTRPSIYITKEQAERMMKQFEIREPGRTFCITAVGSLPIERAKELDAEMARLHRIEHLYNQLRSFMKYTAEASDAMTAKTKESEGSNEQGAAQGD